jgi:hypothetical protein
LQIQVRNLNFKDEIFFEEMKRGDNLYRNFTPRIRKIKKINVETFIGLKKLINK